MESISADESENMVIQPKAYKVNLYPHQLAGIALMEVQEATKTTIIDHHDHGVTTQTVLHN